MPVNLTADQVIGMAPDAGSAKSGKDLATVRKWVVLGADDRCAWGECQGSGANPYQTRIDLSDIAFKCSCPSRKFPCKHGLGLLLLLVENAAAFTQKQPPTWVAEWLDGRQQRTDKKAAKKAEEAEKPVDPVAQAKRLDKRKEKVGAGVAELDRWLQDIMRQGLASMPSKPFSFWDTMGAHLVDAQAPGLARMVRDCSGISSTGEGWQERLLERLGRIYLVVEAYNRLDQLPEDLQEEIKTVVGFTVNQDELLAKSGVTDTWEVIGQHIEQEERLRVQRTWMRACKTQQWALVLSFAHGTAPLDTSLVAGSQITGEVVYFPAAMPMRALVKSKSENPALLQEFQGITINAAFDQYSNALAQNPWIERFPMALQDVLPVRREDSWCLVDQENSSINISMQWLPGWELVALSSGNPISVFGEWDGNILVPLAVANKKSFVRL